MLNRRRQIGLYKTRKNYGRNNRNQCHNNRVMLEKTPIICIKCETSFQSHDAFLEHFTKGQCDRGVQHFAGDAAVHEAESSESILPIISEADSEDESRKSSLKCTKENAEDIMCQPELLDEEPGFLPLLVKLEEIDEPYDGSCVKNIAAVNSTSSELACDNVEDDDEMVTAHHSSSPAPVPNKLQVVNKGMSHQNGQNAVPLIAGQTYSCKECGKAFCSKEKLDIHVQIHSSSNNNMYVCSFCNESFKYECYLRVHQQQHTPCEICGAIFKSRVALKVHKQVHQQDKSMRCKTCGMAYRTKANLARHESIHLKQKLAS